jgi:hypothetical protein
MMAGQLDLFSWATPKPKLRREGFIRERVECKIGPHWWFSRYLVIGDGTGRVVPDLRPSARPWWYQFRA